MDLSLLFPILILLLFIPIFLSGRKQKRQMAETQQMQNALSEGDVVTTTSGLRGTVVDTSYEDTIDLEIADGIVTTWLRAAVRDKVATDSAADEVEETPATDVPDSPAALDATDTTSTTSTNGTNPTSTDATVETPADDKK
jgi:preprotein translocase subunit YajC